MERRTTKDPIGDRITPAVISAWQHADREALHIALGLKPWQPSPLPVEITLLGVGEDNLDPQNREDSLIALKLQRRLLAIAGWPNCRQTYEENLLDGERHLSYCRDRVDHPPVGDRGNYRNGPEYRQEDLEDGIEAVAYRRELLAELDQVRRKWKPSVPQL